VKEDSPASEVMIRLQDSREKKTDTVGRENTAGEGIKKKDPGAAT
jgi:hypothetical protein